MKSKVVRIKEDAIEILQQYNENLSEAIYEMESKLNKRKKV